MGSRAQSYLDSSGRNPRLRARWGAGQVAREERDRKCVQMKHAGHDWNTIVSALGYASPGHAKDRYSLYLERQPPLPGINEARVEEMARLDRLLLALEPKLAAHDVRAVEVAIKLTERRARLGGYDPAVKTQTTIVTDEVITEIIAQRRAALEAKKNAAIAAGIDLSDNMIIDAEVVPEAVPVESSPPVTSPARLGSRGRNL